MKALKIIGILVLVLIIGFGGLVYYGLQNLDGIVKNAIEKYGSEAVGTQVSLNSVNIELRTGRVELHGLQIANPPGYSTPYAFALNEIAVQVKPGSIGGSPIIVDEILIDEPSINAEEKGLSQTNLTDLANNLNKGGSGSSAPAEEPSGSADMPNIAVSSFQFSRANISLVSEQYGDRTVNMPSFTTKNLGGDQGLPPDQLAVALMDEVIDQARDAVADATKDAAKQKLREEGKKAIDENLSDEDKQKLDDLKSRLGR